MKWKIAAEAKHYDRLAYDPPRFLPTFTPLAFSRWSIASKGCFLIILGPE